MKMKAAMLHGPKELVTELVDIPVPNDEELLVRIKATAICGTDIAIYLGQIPAKYYPIPVGHEGVGIVEDMGKDVTGFEKGDHVIFVPAYFCGACFYCKQGLTNICEKAALMGLARDGCFAEYAVVPARAAVKMPKEISWEDGSTIQSLATVINAWELLEKAGPPKKGEVVVIIGIATPGLFFTRLAVMSGATVYACSRSQWKLDLAKEAGAIPVNAKEEDLLQIVRDATNGRGADYVIEAAGVAATLQQSIEVARPGGTILAFGILKDLAGVNGYNLYFKQLTLLGCRAMTVPSYERSIKLVQAGEFDMKSIITDRFTLDEVKENFDAMDKDPGAHSRMVCSM